MIKKWLTWINLGVAGCAAALFVLAIFLFFSRSSDVQPPEIVFQKPVLPQNSFAQLGEHYETFGDPFLSLQYTPMTLRLPDLRHFLLFIGRNARPDSDSENASLHFGLSDQQTVGSLKPGERLYLLYDKQKAQGQYTFSPSNTPTSLWIEATAKDNEALVHVYMKSDTGELIQEPHDHTLLTIKGKENARAPQEKWELGKWRVDGTLLVRQKARWYGLDQFLQKHGGDEFHDQVGKQRLDFGEGDEAYSVYIGPGDALVWDDDVWKNVKPGKDSVGHPLIVVNKIEDRLMKLDLWDVDGRAKVPLTLLRSTETWIPQQLEKQFKFVGARTRSQFVFEVNDERMFIRPKDWLVMTPEGWKKIGTVKELDDFVDRKLVGPLFVFEGVETKEGKQVLVGSLFNASRTDVQTVEIPVQQGTANFTAIARNKEKDKQPKNEVDDDEDQDDSEKHVNNNKLEKLKQNSGENIPGMRSPKESDI